MGDVKTNMTGISTLLANPRVIRLECIRPSLRAIISITGTDNEIGPPATARLCWIELTPVTRVFVHKGRITAFLKVLRGPAAETGGAPALALSLR
jgi:hypothetical protein